VHLRRASVLLALVLLATPLAAVAQRAGKVHRVGYLSPVSLALQTQSGVLEAFRQGMRDLGYIEGQNLVIEYRWAEGQPQRLPDLAASLVQLPVDVIVASGPDGIRAAQGATNTVPIVMTVIHEPVALGLIKSLSRPGGNTTGLAFQDSELTTKRLQLLRETVAGLSRVAFLWDPAGGGPQQRQAAEEAARRLGLDAQSLPVRGAGELEGAFAEATRRRAQAVVQLASPMFSAHRPTIAALATKAGLPMTCETKDFVAAGCLMSYGPRFTDMFRRAAWYVDRILNGAKPADLPVEQPARFELIVSARTAKALSLTISASVLGVADQVLDP
jgi:putative tryptophan/tyrosine transport system substrate-binding protein